MIMGRSLSQESTSPVEVPSSWAKSETNGIPTGATRQHPWIWLLAAAALMASVLAHVFRRDATWATENAMLFMALTIVAAWCGPGWPVLILAAVGMVAWYWTDRSTILPHAWAIRVAVTGILMSLARMMRIRFDREFEFARTDELTGIPNRRGLLESLDQELTGPGNQGRWFALAMIDCDEFKKINDQYGHPAGDRVLRRVAGILRQHLRDGGQIGRLAGDEFCFFITNSEAIETQSMIDLLRQRLSQEFCTDFADLTFSFGVVMGSVRQPQAFPSFPLEVLERADQAMYAAKCDGNGRVRYDRIIESK
jgi:diguanylate cyclase (GGDEF)-like protein